MKFPHVIQAVYFAPWSITPEGWRAVHAIVKPHVLGVDKLAIPQSSDDDTDFFGEPLPRMEIRPDGVCIIPVIGTLLQHASLLDKQCGACSYDDIRRDLQQAVNTPGINKIVLNINSPGGMSMGSHECAQAVENAAELLRVEAVTDALMCSAAYELASSADRIYCTPTASVGSIGCLLPWMDQSVRYEMAGLKMELFASGPLKGAGWPGTELTTEQREHFQSTVDRFAGIFKDHVLSHRLVDEHAMRGQSVLGVDAVECGLVDELVDDIEDCFEPLKDE